MQDVFDWQMVADQIPQLVQGVRGSQAQPDSPSAQLALIGASQNFLQVLCEAQSFQELSLRIDILAHDVSLFFSHHQPGAKMVTAAKATVPTISDQASAMQLSQCAKNLASALAELRTAAQKVIEIC